MKWVFAIIVAFSLTGTIFFFQQRTVEERPQRTDKDVKVVLVGDVMLDRGVEYMIEKKGNGDFKFPFLEIADYLRKADILFGNLEGPISDKGEKVGSIYSFRAEPKVIEGLTYAGFDILSLANNHAFDYGWEALEDTLNRLEEADIGYAGTGHPVIKEVKGTKIGFLAYTNLGLPFWGISWADWNNLEEIKKEIQEVKQKVDILIVSLHAGEEYSKEPNQFQVNFSKAAIEAGADVVVGHHPHVIQPNEKYKEGYIFYSLGNFIFDQGFSEETMKGQIVEILIEEGEIKEVYPREIKINEFFQVTVNVQ